MKIFFLILSGAILFSVTGCENENPSTPGGKIKGHSDCKYGKSAEADTLSCISYEFDADNHKLLLHHLNAGFNCCTDIGCTVSANGDTIIINEIEGGEKCRCECLFDVDIELTGIEPKPYCIRINELYSGGMELLNFSIDLTAEAEGEYCVTRNTYPWGIQSYEEEDIEGGLIASSECKLFGKSNNNSSNTSCIHFTYDETTRQLSLGHINAAFNCCPDSIYCQVSEDNDTITIEEFEGMGLCDCICLYDLDIRIEGMLPKMYYIKVVEPSIDDDERLYFNVDLGLTPTGDYCVPRNSYPWGL